MDLWKAFMNFIKGILGKEKKKDKDKEQPK